MLERLLNMEKMINKVKKKSVYWIGHWNDSISVILTLSVSRHTYWVYFKIWHP